MPNWEGWSNGVKVVSRIGDSSLSAEDREILERIFVPLGAALASTASRSQLYHDLASCQVSGECGPLKYDPKKDRFVFFKDGKERELDPDYFVERGFKVCKTRGSGDIYIRFGKTEKGMLAVSYDGVSCDPGDEELGTVHLHPAGAVFPSGTDMFFFSTDKYNCIAGKVYDPSARKDFARVLCAVTDDVFQYDLSPEERRSGRVNIGEIVAEFPELLKMKSEYESRVNRLMDKFSFFTLRVEDAKGNRFEYVFPPRAPAALYELVRIAKDVYRDSHKFELYSVDLSESEPPSLSSLEK